MVQLANCWKHPEYAPNGKQTSTVESLFGDLFGDICLVESLFGDLFGNV